MTNKPQIEALYPLSSSQTGMLLQCIASDDSRLFVEQVATCIEGELDFDAFVQAWQQLSDRHPALRSAILSKGKAHVQAVLNRVTVKPRIESSTMDAEQNVLKQIMTEEQDRGFLLKRPPLIRFAVLRISPTRIWWITTFHHIILDGWSLPLMWSELISIYRGEKPDLAPDYRNYIDWLKNRSTDAAQSYWHERLTGFTMPNRIAGISSDRNVDELERLIAGGGKRITDMAKQEQVSAALILEVLWAALIGAKTASNDVIFGATVSGRPSSVKGIDRMPGMFINTVPIRVQLFQQRNLAQLIQYHAEQRAEQSEYEFCSAGQIQEWSGLGVSLYQTLMIYENSPATKTSVLPTSLKISDQHLSGARSSLPLTILVSPGEDLHLRAVFYPSAINAELVTEILAEFAAIIERTDLKMTAAELTQQCALIQRLPGQQVQYVAARNRIEVEMVAIWEKIFSQRVSVLDDFFALGAHSLLSLQMLAMVKERLGFDIPLEALIRNSTIETLAASLETDPDQKESALVTLASGSGPPLYCIHPLGGHVLCYASLAKQLASKLSCFGMQAKGLSGKEPPAASWNELIDYHYSLLDAQHDSSQPLALLGYSFGGYIALELAERATAMGWTVLPVMLLDVPQISIIPKEQLHPDAATLMHALFGHSLDFELNDLQAMSRNELLEQIYNDAVRHHLLPPNYTLAQLKKLLEVAETHAGLQPPNKNYELDAVLLRARERANRITTMEDMGWSTKLRELEIHWVEGSHETMLEHGNLDKSVDCILNWIKKQFKVTR